MWIQNTEPTPLHALERPIDCFCSALSLTPGCGGPHSPPPPPFIPITPERRGMSGKQLVLSKCRSAWRQTDGPRDTVKSFA